MELEIDIDDILSNIKDIDMKTTLELEETNNDIIDAVYSKFIKYDKNKENIKITKGKISRLKYEYIENTIDLNGNDSLFGINLQNFYDLKLNYLGIFYKINNDILILNKFNRIYKIKSEHYILFRKLNSKNKINLLLMDTLSASNN
jgi:hypothetical protein|tara:strand:+ start:222 stop:659 length:438 start_codon:yes stop_codon:yes gene_type:complete